MMSYFQNSFPNLSVQQDHKESRSNDNIPLWLRFIQLNLLRIVAP